MELKPALKKLQESQEFKKWQLKNKSTYFSYAFKILQEMDTDEWQIGFYNKKKERITTFVIGSSSIKVRAEEEVIKKEDTKINEIHLGKVNIAFEDAIAKAC